MKLIRISLFTLLLACSLLACEDSNSTANNHAVKQAYAQQQSKVWLELSGTVIKLLPDDNKGSRHQRFIIRIAPQHTVLIAHNIDLAPYIPLYTGQAIQARGRYEWNKKGGVLHWTHHDPKGKKAGGWIEVDGKHYK